MNILVEEKNELYNHKKIYIYIYILNDAFRLSYSMLLKINLHARLEYISRVEARTETTRIF